MDYPQYRKYKNNQSYFKIKSATEFDEIKREANSWKIYSFKAAILPDRNYILDMTTDYSLYWDKITAEEFDAILNQVDEK
ncbi:MAG: hypothetical protein KJZ55_06115 [Flavobacteriales bacterium]|nr:hypothetical protein [Flavobacteriales bacterium]